MMRFKEQITDIFNHKENHSHEIRNTEHKTPPPSPTKRQHRTLEERIQEYGGKLGPYEEFDWGEPAGRENWQI